jgi:hypothetical protein
MVVHKPEEMLRLTLCDSYGPDAKPTYYYHIFPENPIKVDFDMMVVEIRDICP